MWVVLNPGNGSNSSAGMPGWHTITTTCIVGFNVVANYALISAYGAVGAALATAGAFVFAAIALVIATRRLLGVTI